MQWGVVHQLYQANQNFPPLFHCSAKHLMYFYILIINVLLIILLHFLSHPVLSLHFASIGPNHWAAASIDYWTHSQDQVSCYGNSLQETDETVHHMSSCLVIRGFSDSHSKWSDPRTKSNSGLGHCSLTGTLLAKWQLDTISIIIHEFLPTCMPLKGGQACLMSPFCLESQSYHLLPHFCLLSCSSAYSCCSVFYLLMAHCLDFFPPKNYSIFSIKK